MKTKTLITLSLIIILITGGAVYGQGDVKQKDPGGYQKVVKERKHDTQIIQEHPNTTDNSAVLHLVAAYSNDDQITAAEHKLLIKITYLESRGEPLKGKTAVVRTILNRVESEDFPNNIEEVIYQKGQFQPAKYLEKVEIEEGYLEEIEEAIIAALESKGEEMYFVNPEYADESCYSWMVDNLTFIRRVGNHEFYK